MAIGRVCGAGADTGQKWNAPGAGALSKGGSERGMHQIRTGAWKYVIYLA